MRIEPHFRDPLSPKPSQNTEAFVQLMTAHQGRLYRFTVDWMPGQTEFALCMHGQIDGRKVAFTGDNIFGNPGDPTQTGHEAMVAHNSAIPEEGYIYGTEYLSQLKPDILVGVPTTRKTTFL